MHKVKVCVCARVWYRFKTHPDKTGNVAASLAHPWFNLYWPKLLLHMVPYH